MSSDLCQQYEPLSSLPSKNVSSYNAPDTPSDFESQHSSSRPEEGKPMRPIGPSVHQRHIDSCTPYLHFQVVSSYIPIVRCMQIVYNANQSPASPETFLFPPGKSTEATESFASLESCDSFGAESLAQHLFWLPALLLVVTCFEFVFLSEVHQMGGGLQGMISYSSGFG